MKKTIDNQKYVRYNTNIKNECSQRLFVPYVRFRDVRFLEEEIMNTKDYRKNYHYMTQEERDLKRRRAKRVYQLRKRAFMTALSVTLIIAISLIVGNTRSVAENKYDPSLSVTFKSVMIESGDTLWSIASEQTEDIAEISCKDYIKEVKRLNKLGSDKLVSGDYIVLPIYSYTNSNM